MVVAMGSSNELARGEVAEDVDALNSGIGGSNISAAMFAVGDLRCAAFAFAQICATLIAVGDLSWITGSSMFGSFPVTSSLLVHSKPSDSSASDLPGI